MTLTLSWIEGRQALAAWHDPWRDLVQRTGADIYLTPDWLEAWWAELGPGRRLVALMAQEAGRLVGLLPFMIDRLWVGPLPLRVGRFAATDPNCLILTLPVETPHVARMLQAASAGLFDRYGCSVISLTPVSQSASYLPQIETLAGLRPDLIVTRAQQGTHCLFDLPDSFAAFQSEKISNKRRGQYRREVAALTEIFGLQNRDFAPSVAEFDEFVAFHNCQWHAVGKGGHFSDWPRSPQIYRALCASATDGQGLRLYAQSGAEGPLATQMSLLSGQTCHWRLPARTLDPRADKLSIGKVGLLLMIEDLIAAGITRIEGGRGEYDYKTAHGGQNVPVLRILISRNRAVNRALLQLVVAWSDLVDFAYYRVWFKKIAPVLRKKVGLPMRPLWRLWIGSRL